MTVDLHNHTVLCNHAEGSIDEYIERAISEGIDVFGFADHAPMDFDGNYRMDFRQMREYEEKIRNAAEKYRPSIDIRLGYEVDWLPGHMDKRVLEADVDYLIGSVHFLDGWGFDNPEFIGRYEHADIDAIWEEYFGSIEAMAESRLFDIVGHLDLIKVFNYLPKRPVEEFAESALDAIASSGMALEINAAGYRKPVAQAYPSLSLLKMAFERKIPVTFGSDAHRPEQVGYMKEAIRELARNAGYSRCAVYKNRKIQLPKF